MASVGVGGRAGCCGSASERYAQPRSTWLRSPHTSSESGAPVASDPGCFHSLARSPDDSPARSLAR
eukprot:8703745-Alexandrium_andersonii.AAC.1